jgi:aldehyde:ferredoxin oxidoreductase
MRKKPNNTRRVIKRRKGIFKNPKRVFIPKITSAHQKIVMENLPMKKKKYSLWQKKKKMTKKKLQKIRLMKKMKV